jgi:hypothetical protein
MTQILNNKINNILSFFETTGEPEPMLTTLFLSYKKSLEMGIDISEDTMTEITTDIQTCIDYYNIN